MACVISPGFAAARLALPPASVHPPSWATFRQFVVKDRSTMCCPLPRTRLLLILQNYERQPSHLCHVLFGVKVRSFICSISCRSGLYCLTNSQNCHIYTYY